VEVRGTTGSCNRAGTLTFHGIPNEASVNVTGDDHGAFVARLTVPTGTFPNAHKLELTVDCNGQLQRAKGELTVINLAPVAVNDSATTAQDTPVAIAVTANDRNPDPDTGHQLLVVEHGSPPPNGTIQAQPDGTITYTPRAGFSGQDQFQYGLCDNVINAAGQADCGIATVTVTVNPTTPTTTTGVSPTTTPPTTTSPCAPLAGDLRQRLQVTPVKGSGGTKLHVTATVDPRLAACPLRLLLSGAPLGPDLSVGLDGGISEDRPVPTDGIVGSSTLQLAATGGQILDQTSFEILPTLIKRWWQRDPYRLLLGVGALLGGALVREAIRRLRRRLQGHDDLDQARQHGLRADPYTRPLEVTVEPDTEDRPTLVVRLQPHGDAGALTLQEVPR
jgi:Bacterial Ig domain